MKILLASAIFMFSLAARAECVILLHGLARSANSMSKIEAELKKAGFAVQNVAYQSRDYAIEYLAKEAIEPAIVRCGDHPKISFVTHSMGGILVRQYLREIELPKLNRVVMLGPPNKGSEVVDKLGKFPGFHFINGDSGVLVKQNRTLLFESFQS
jgi:triacylglycerol esterase/lipase EstA (alpha/beta hydrolase family)